MDSRPLDLLKKGLDGLPTRPDIFSVDDAVAVLGVGKNRVRSICHWCLATEVLGMPSSGVMACNRAHLSLPKNAALRP